MRLLKNLMQRLYMNAHSHNFSNSLALLPKGANLRLLDLGCYDGEWTLKLANRMNTTNVHALEILSAPAAVARTRGITVLETDLEIVWPFPDADFDVVHASFVIEHVCRMDHFISEMFRVLKPGGRVVVTTENGSSWHNVFAAVLGWQTFSSSCCSTKVKGLGNPIALHRGQGPSEFSQTHKIIFNFRGYREIFEAHNFTNIKILGAGYYPLPTLFAKADPRHAHFLCLSAEKPA